MNRNDLITIAQRLREYVGNPHHVDPMSDAFKMLIGEASEALSQAAQPQGVPVAYRYKSNVENERSFKGKDEWHLTEYKSTVEMVHKMNPLAESQPLYAEQPAPVAVVLPDRLNHSDGLHTYEYVTAHNAAIEKMLNTK